MGSPIRFQGHGTVEDLVNVERDLRISELSLHSLRVELRRRKLSTTGLRPTLENRLALDLRASRSSSRIWRQSGTLKRVKLAVDHRNFHRPRGTISVPSRFPDNDVPHLAPSICRRSHVQGAIAQYPLINSAAVRVGQPIFTCTGIVREQAVWIMGQEQMTAFWEMMGPCGKANLSRSAPSYNIPEDSRSALKGRAMRQLMVLEETGDPSHLSRVQRADREHLQLTLVEAFYSSFVAKRLVLKEANGGECLIDPSSTWSLFCDRSARFPLLFVAYCRYRSAGWLPRSGIKYGVDWVLYPASTVRHAHAPYCIIVRLGTDPEVAPIDRSWIRLQNRLRLVKNVAKTLVVATVSLNDEADLTKSFETAFREAQISEMTVDRWIP